MKGTPALMGDPFEVPKKFYLNLGKYVLYAREAFGEKYAMLPRGNVAKTAKLFAELCGGWWGLMSGALSIPFALAAFFWSHQKMLFAVLAYCALWALVLRMGWKNYQLMETIKSSEIAGEDKRARKERADKAVEKLTELATAIFQRISVVKATDPNKYDADADDELWKSNDAVIVYIGLNLNQDAAVAYDDGVKSINAYSTQPLGIGTTQREDDHRVVLARFNQRLSNLRRITDDIHKYLKPSN